MNLLSINLLAMRIFVSCFVLVLCNQSLFAQDTMRVTYSEETDTLIKQRFIDRYENVFMTKVATRHMLKVGVGRNSFKRTFESSELSHEIGYEYKIAQAFSVGLNATLDGSFYFNPSFVGTVSLNAYGRWYYDMKRRIKEGRSANNFSGNFIAAVAEKRWRYVPNSLPILRTGLEFGVQRRFLNFGRLEFAVGLSYLHYSFPNSEGGGDIRNADHDITLSTRSNLGLAFGDWKSSNNISTCEILNCDEIVREQWKVLWPDINIGTRLIQGMIGVGYERKLGKSPLSLNGQIIADYFKSEQTYMDFYPQSARNTLELNPVLQLRYYYLQKRKIRKGRGGNNLSGIYIGPQFEYVHHQNLNVSWNREHLGNCLTYGYQKTLFGNVFIDVNSAFTWNILDRKETRTTLRLGFGLSL